MLGDAVLMGAAVGSTLSVRYFHNISTLLPNWVGKKQTNKIVQKVIRAGDLSEQRHYSTSWCFSFANVGHSSKESWQLINGRNKYF